MAGLSSMRLDMPWSLCVKEVSFMNMANPVEEKWKTNLELHDLIIEMADSICKS